MPQPQIANIGWVQIRIPSDYGILRCEICRQDIGRFKPEKLAAPLKADMFEAIAPGYPHPFRIVPGLPMSLQWENASCPYCRKRPFLDKNAVMTPHGKFKVGDLRPPGPTDPIVDLERARQQEINRIWAEEIQGQDEITMSDLREMYPGRTQAEYNQMMIEMEFPKAEKEEDVPHETPASPKDVKGRLSFLRRKPGRPKKDVLQTILKGD